MLTKEGGLLGLSGVSNDLRDIKEAAERESERARLAIDVYVNGIVRYIGAFYAELGGLNFLVFTGGIGENMPWLRELVCAGLKHMGIELSKRRNAGGEPFRIVSRNTSKVEVLVVPANEELGVARKTFQYSPG
jgi:acetate kinase